MLLAARTFGPLLPVVTAWTFLALAQAQYVQDGPKLVGSGSVGNAAQGRSVALSADGNTALIGGPLDQTAGTDTYTLGSVGAAWVFVRNGNVWVQQGPKLVGTGAALPAQGSSVALSADGNTALVGGTNVSWVFTRTAGVWTQQGSSLGGGGGVALSADGNTALTGTQIWTRSNGIWSPQGSPLFRLEDWTSSFFPPNWSRQGSSVALSADGNTAAIGAPYDDAYPSVGSLGCYGGSGAIWVWTRSSGGAWALQGPKLVGTDPTSPANRGHSVALSSDGNTLLTGGPNDIPVPAACVHVGVGAAWAWTRNGSTWTQAGPKLAGPGGAQGGQGWSVALSGDGTAVLVGGYGVEGAAMWMRSGGAWTQQGSILTGTGAAGAAQQGWSVALSSDQTTALVGGPSDNGGAGAVWVFTSAAFPAPKGTPVLVWQEETTRRVVVDYFSGSTMLGWNWLYPGLGADGWHIVAIADFNIDGFPDLVWQNDRTRQVTVHYYAGVGGATDLGWNWLYPGMGAAGWRVAAAADFNGDRVPDLVWQNDATNQVTVHYYGGPGGATDLDWNWLYPGMGAAGWHVAAAADFNGDRVPDLVWQNDATSQVTVHYYGGPGGATDLGWNWLYPTAIPAGWHVAKAADFNADGVPDLVWQNNATGQVTVHYYGGSQGATDLGWNWLYPGDAAGWSVK